MAKKKPAGKTVKKSARPAAKNAKAKPAKKPARKVGAKPAKKTSPRGGSAAGPETISTGSGATPLEIGRELVRLFNAGEVRSIEERFWSPDITSVEGLGVSQAWHGKAAVEGKNAWWSQDHTLHGASAEGPYVGATGFAVKFTLDVETRSTGSRVVMNEVGVYTVKNGKICREEFMYGVG